MRQYTTNNIIDAMYDCWLLLREKLEDQKDYGASSPELTALMEKHPCLVELDESGPKGWCGIGLGNMGGHAV